MPGTYAHYRFGQAALAMLSDKQQRTARRFRQLFDMGLHGPDIFYYTDPLGLASNGKMGKRFHNMTGVDFFAHVVRALKLKPSEGAMAYFYGLVAHYALDSISHPFVSRNVTAERSPIQIMTEFDRYLLVIDGKKPPCLYDPSRHISLTEGECQTVAAMYPGISPAQVQSCVKNMARCARGIALEQGPGRDVKLALLNLTAKETAQRVIGLRPNRNCAGLNASQLRLFELAQKRYAALMEQLQIHMRKNTPLGTDFAAVFGE